MNLRKHLVMIPVFVFLASVMAGAVFVEPALADSVSITGPPKTVYRGNVPFFKVYFNVSNDGPDAQPIYDFHVTVQGATVVAVSSPKGWHPPVRTDSEVTWKTNNKPIVNGTSNAGFDIVTNLPAYSVYWMTTDKNGTKINDGYFNVP